MTEPMNAADVPDEIFLAYDAAESACWGHPDHGLRYAQCCRLAGLAAALPLYAQQLGAQLGRFTMACPHHKAPEANPQCIPCQRYTALIGARRLIEGRNFSAEAVRQLRADSVAAVGCNCPAGMAYHALNCPAVPGQPMIFDLMEGR